jgi:hypothetical protein
MTDYEFLNVLPHADEHEVLYTQFITTSNCDAAPVAMGCSEDNLIPNVVTFTIVGLRKGIPQPISSEKVINIFEFGHT